MPMASMRANMVVGPTKANPFLRSAFDRAFDSSDDGRHLGVVVWA